MGRDLDAADVSKELHELSEALQAVSFYFSAARRRATNADTVTFSKGEALRIVDQTARANCTLHRLRVALRNVDVDLALDREFLAMPEASGFIVSTAAHGEGRTSLKPPLRFSKEARQAIAEIEQLRCKIWLRTFMQGRLPRMMTKAELRDIATQKMGVSKASFDSAWIWAIEEAGRDDWYAPLRVKRHRAR